MPRAILLLSQQAASGQSVTIFGWLGAIVLASFVIVGVALIVRRRVLGGQDESAMPGFTLADLRRMHREGQLSDQEFAAARAGMVARSRSALLENESATALDQPPSTDADDDPNGPAPPCSDKDDDPRTGPPNA